MRIYWINRIPITMEQKKGTNKYRGKLVNTIEYEDLLAIWFAPKWGKVLTYDKGVEVCQK